MIDKNAIVSRTPGHMSAVYAELVTTPPSRPSLRRGPGRTNRRIREEA
jgi:hypothetical protein